MTVLVTVNQVPRTTTLQTSMGEPMPFTIGASLSEAVEFLGSFDLKSKGKVFHGYLIGKINTDFPYPVEEVVIGGSHDPATGNQDAPSCN